MTFILNRYSSLLLLLPLYSSRCVTVEEGKGAKGHSGGCYTAHTRRPVVHIWNVLVLNHADLDASSSACTVQSLHARHPFPPSSSRFVSMTSTSTLYYFVGVSVAWMLFFRNNRRHSHLDSTIWAQGPHWTALVKQLKAKGHGQRKLGGVKCCTYFPL